MFIYACMCNCYCNTVVSSPYREIFICPKIIAADACVNCLFMLVMNPGQLYIISRVASMIKMCRKILDNFLTD